MSCCCSSKAKNKTEVRKETLLQQVDPVCKMTVNTADAQKTIHGGREYFFCSEGCAKRFIARPESFLQAA